ncbi:uncharacterized protein EI97DRAFT_400083 [Westerdykella ornata]|uniref:AhpC-TSA-domain-containing protein n=1 Tax=Westerdykella ornata TaxID=318751 RepID=A0A6A6JH89_WESOR|nr:uncharacterized protein EI97DRAFT_400083 [Westerdykella ornata]KAF2275737.1 hypothetical protein EI97DRAFT_400083 [Westerdykella ornata]
MARTDSTPSEPKPPTSSPAPVPQAPTTSEESTAFRPSSQSGDEPRLSMASTEAAEPPFSPSSTTPVLEKDEEDSDFGSHSEVNDDLPTEKDLKRVENLLILDSKGQSRPFKDLYSGEGVAPRQLIIFVRHFFCGNCQEYLRTLSSSITPESLLALPTPAFITVIGCGRPELIDMYAETTKCPFPIYAEPTRKLYDILGMTRTYELGKKPDYIHTNLFVSSVQSVVQGLKTGNKALKGGDFKQAGGEFLFEHGKPVWAHRMRNTRDHTEVEELRQVLGLEVVKAPLRKSWSHGVKEEGGRKRSSSWGRLRSLSKGAKEKFGEKEKEKKVVEEGAA